MKKTILLIIALVALALFLFGLFEAYQVMGEKPEEVKKFNDSFWTYIITSINGLLIINLSSLLGVTLFEAEKIAFRQWVALFYMLILLVVFVLWALTDFDTSESIPVVISQISKSFFALMLAALGMILKETIMNKKGI